ncbi:hypothetical protein GCM10009692_24380 [Leucobacter aridicollis]
MSGCGPGVREFPDQAQQFGTFALVQRCEGRRGFVALAIPHAVDELFSGLCEPYPRAPRVSGIGFALSVPKRHGLLHEAGGARLIHTDVVREFANRKRFGGVREDAEHSHERRTSRATGASTRAASAAVAVAVPGSPGRGAPWVVPVTSGAAKPPVLSVAKLAAFPMLSAAPRPIECTVRASSAAVGGAAMSIEAAAFTEPTWPAVAAWPAMTTGAASASAPAHLSECLDECVCVGRSGLARLLGL